MRFFLGTHNPSWLWNAPIGGPFFVSRRTLCRYKTLRRAKVRWALDSGGFSELSMFGRWTVTAQEYASEVRRYAEEIGGLEWSAGQDWMCEPWITEKTGRSVEYHQHKTCENLLELRSLEPMLRFIPTLQGWNLGDYIDHVRIWSSYGVDLYSEPVVGVGSVCRRQKTDEIGAIFRELARGGLLMHGFGVKSQGLKKYGDLLRSADSLAWSFTARRKPPLPGCTHKNCANCPKFADLWRSNVLRTSKNKTQRRLL